MSYLYQPDPKSLFSDIETHKERVLNRINRHGIADSKIIHKYIPTGERLSDSLCNFRTIKFRIDGSTFPHDFILPASIMLSKKVSPMNAELTAAYVQLLNFGLVKGLKRISISSHRGDSFTKSYLYHKCEEELRPKLRAPEYNASIGQLRDHTLIFLPLVLGYACAGVILLSELLAFYAGWYSKAKEMRVLGKLERQEKVVKSVLRLLESDRGLAMVEQFLRVNKPS